MRNSNFILILVLVADSQLFSLKYETGCRGSQILSNIAYFSIMFAK